MTSKPKTYDDIIKLLGRPFRPEEINFLGKGGYIMAYTDARAVRSRLTLAAGAGWTSKLIPLPEGDMICELTILGVTRSDVGEKHGFGGSGAKGAASDALKRAAFNHGVGEYLYDLPTWKAHQGPGLDTASGLKYWRQRYTQWLQEYGIAHYGQPVGLEIMEENEPELLDHVSDYQGMRRQIGEALRSDLISVDDVRRIVEQLRLPDDMTIWNARARLDFLVDFGKELSDREDSKAKLEAIENE